MNLTFFLPALAVALFAHFGLTLALSFSGAMSRLDALTMQWSSR